MSVWVEVYFPDIGWVPFEPTRGFTNPTDFKTEKVEPVEPEIEPEELETDDEILFKVDENE